MKDISLHMLDIIRNSVKAGARKIGITIMDDRKKNRLVLKISDDGTGIPDEIIGYVTDPFFTTSANKKTGLGIPLLKQNAEQTGGRLEIKSDSKKGTSIKAVFRQDHIDMIPQGDIAATLRVIIASEPDIDIRYKHFVDDEGFELNTAVIRQAVSGTGLNSPGVLDYITEFVERNLEKINTVKYKENKI